MHPSSAASSRKWKAKRRKKNIHNYYVSTNKSIFKWKLVQKSIHIKGISITFQPSKLILEFLCFSFGCLASIVVGVECMNRCLSCEKGTANVSRHLCPASCTPRPLGFQNTHTHDCPSLSAVPGKKENPASPVDKEQFENNRSELVCDSN